MTDRRAERRTARAARSAFVVGLAPVVRAALQHGLARQILPHLPTSPFVLASYMAVGDEIDPRFVHTDCLQADIAFPRVNGPALPLSFHAVAADTMERGPLAIPQPPPSAPVLMPSVLLVPLLSADRHGNRLGQGGGFYDRTLAAFRAASPIIAIGVAWDVQVAERLVPAPWDQPLDALATPTAFLWCRNTAMPF